MYQSEAWEKGPDGMAGSRVRTFVAVGGEAVQDDSGDRVWKVWEVMGG